MTPMPSMDAVAVGQQCLQQMDALQNELASAMDAIARNSLADFEHSLWQQEMLSTGMRRSLLLLGSLPLDEALRSRLQVAGAALQQVSAIYGRLLDQSTRCGAVLRDLCSLYQTSPVQATPAVTNAFSFEA